MLYSGSKMFILECEHKLSELLLLTDTDDEIGLTMIGTF